MNATNEYPTDAQIEDEARLYSLDLANGLDWCFDDFNLKCFVRALLTPFSALPIDEDALTTEKVAAQPVAWMYKKPEWSNWIYKEWTSDGFGEDANEYERIALYAPVQSCGDAEQADEAVTADARRYRWLLNQESFSCDHFRWAMHRNPQEVDTVIDRKIGEKNA